MTTVENISSTTRSTVQGRRLGPGPSTGRRKWARMPTWLRCSGRGAPTSSSTPQSKASTRPPGRGRARDTFLHPESRQADRVRGASNSSATGCMGWKRP